MPIFSSVPWPCSIATANGVHVVLTVHDEIVLECPDEQVEEATRILKDAMVQACRGTRRW